MNVCHLRMDPRRPNWANSQQDVPKVRWMHSNFNYRKQCVSASVEQLDQPLLWKVRGSLIWPEDKERAAMPYGC